MKNIIVGTSGHVDHGKTCLIRALTGTDCDRLKEEKKRGITIENGFADLTYEDYNISIIDVPGHEKFVRNMLMGIGGIDLVLLVIALDEGVMPQTIEHFRILTMLNLSKGIIVFTKKDLVTDNDWIEMVKDDTKKLVEGTFMENAPTISVSSFTGENIEELKKLIVDNIDDNILKNEEDSLFRLPIDRVFTIEGFGTVITGTLIEGKVNVGDEIMLYPKKIPVKVRNIEVHNEQVKTAYAGQRTALNLLGIKKEDIERGSVLGSPDLIIPTNRLDVLLKVFLDSEKNILNESMVHIYSGASETLAKVFLLDRDILKKGEECYASLKLEDEIVVRRNDRFIVRFFSPLISIGGGKILEEHPKKHKKNDEKALSSLKLKDEGTNLDVLEVLVKENIFTKKELEVKMRLTSSELSNLLDELKSKVLVLKTGHILHNEYISICEKVSNLILEKYHKENSMSIGLSKEEFKSKLIMELRIDKKIVDEIINILCERNIEILDNKVKLKSFKISGSSEIEKRLLKKYLDLGFTMPTIEEALECEKDKKNARHVLELLVSSGKLVKLNPIYCISKEYYDKAIEIVKEKTKKDGSISLAEFRDLTGTTRKFAIPILEYFDEKKITKMVGDIRVWNSNN